MYYIVSGIYIGGRFLKAGCYFQQVIVAVAKESHITFKLIETAPETQIFQYCNTKCHPKPNQIYVKYGSVFLSGSFRFAQT